MGKSLIEMTIGFIGAGQMASALGSGFVGNGLVPPTQILATDPSAPALAKFLEMTGGSGVDSIQTLIERSDIIFLAVKPQILGSVLPETTLASTPDKLFISVVAGVKLQQLEGGMINDLHVVRVMPNTPCLIGQGACGYSLGANATEDDSQLVQQLLESVGIAYQVKEPLLDAITGLSGSGPAYIYMMIEALSDGGVRAGLPRDMAIKLAAQTVAGAAAMVLETGDHPAVLKDRVASPAGTTIAGIQSLETAGMRAAMMQAVQASAQRAIELGQG